MDDNRQFNENGKNILEKELVKNYGLSKFKFKKKSQIKEEAGVGKTNKMDKKTEPKKKKRKRKVAVVIVLVSAIAVGGVFVFCSKGKKTQEKGNHVMESKVQKGNLSQTVEGTGTLANVDSTDLKIPTGLKIKKIKVSEGDEVKKGDTLATVDKTSLLAALAETQAELDNINSQLGDEAGSDTSKYVEASVAGRIKKIYASKNTNAADTVLKEGALMLISLDGKMTAKMDTSVSLTVGQKVKVVLSNGSNVTGAVVKSDDESCTITVTDKGTKYNDTVTAYTSSGTKIGTGKLSINKEAKVTATSGTVSSILVSENEYVSEGDNLIKLKGDFQSEKYLSLESEKEDLEEKLDSLLKIAKNNTIVADSDGIITAINISEDTSSGSISNSDSTSDSSSTESSTSGSNGSGNNSAKATGTSVNISTGGSKTVTNILAYQTNMQQISEDAVSVNVVDTKNVDATTENSFETTTEVKGETETTTAKNETMESTSDSSSTTSAKSSTTTSSESKSTTGSGDKSTTSSKKNQTNTSGVSDTINGVDKSENGMSERVSSGNVTSGTAGNSSGNVSGNNNSTGTSLDSSSSSTSSEVSTEFTSAFSIASGDEMTVSVNVDEMDILSIDTGQKATITFDAIENKQYEGEITSINKNGVTSNGTTKYPVEITVTKEDSMMSGMNASVTITTSEVSDVILIPAVAVMEEGNTSYVYTEKNSKTGKLSGKTEVQTGETDGTNIVITSGLSEGETIYYSMASGSSNGDSENDSSNKQDMKMDGNFGGGQGGGNGGGTPPSGGNPGGSN